MKEDIKKIIAEQMEILPEDVKNAILSVDYPIQLQEVVKRNRLLIDQAGALERETTLTLMGLEPVLKYTENIARELEISKDKALLVSHDVDELIFKKIRKSLEDIEKLYDIEGEVDTPKEQSREDVMEGIENPLDIKTKEQSISISSLKSNSLNPEYPTETITKGIEIRKEMSLEIPPEAKLPIKTTQSVFAEKVPEPLHQNISPANNIVEEKLTGTVSIPTEKIVIEEVTKLPTKNNNGHDPYREPIM